MLKRLLFGCLFDSRSGNCDEQVFVLRFRFENLKINAEKICVPESAEQEGRWGERNSFRFDAIDRISFDAVGSRTSFTPAGASGDTRPGENLNFSILKPYFLGLETDTTQNPSFGIRWNTVLLIAVVSVSHAGRRRCVWRTRCASFGIRWNNTVVVSGFAGHGFRFPWFSVFR